MRKQALPGGRLCFARNEQADVMPQLRQRLADLHSLDRIGRQGGYAGIGDNGNTHNGSDLFLLGGDKGKRAGEMPDAQVFQ